MNNKIVLTGILATIMATAFLAFGNHAMATLLGGNNRGTTTIQSANGGSANGGDGGNANGGTAIAGKCFFGCSAFGGPGGFGGAGGAGGVGGPGGINIIK